MLGTGLGTVFGNWLVTGIRNKLWNELRNWHKARGWNRFRIKTELGTLLGTGLGIGLEA